MYLLDTNVISELRKINTKRADKNVIAWLKATPQYMNAISVITALELEEGYQQIARRDAEQGYALRVWLNGVYAMFKDAIIEFDLVAVQHTAPLSSPNPMSKRDAMIAGTALAHGLQIVTRNSKDFDSVDGLTLINPWDD